MKSRQVAFGAMVAALSLVLMMLTAVLPVGTYALPCFAGILLVIIVIEFGVPWAVGVYAGVSILSFLLASDKEAALYYTLILGIYPILFKAFVFQYICSSRLLHKHFPAFNSSGKLQPFRHKYATCVPFDGKCGFCCL